MPIHHAAEPQSLVEQTLRIAREAAEVANAKVRARRPVLRVPRRPDAKVMAQARWRRKALLHAKAMAQPKSLPSSSSSSAPAPEPLSPRPPPKAAAQTKKQRRAARSRCRTCSPRRVLSTLAVHKYLDLTKLNRKEPIRGPTFKKKSKNITPPKNRPPPPPGTRVQAKRRKTS
jgi:hypothetical protein